MKPSPTTTPTTTQPKTIHRKQLNSLQIELLRTLYKFRFGTAELLSQYQEQSLRYTNKRLQILFDQEYIGRNYDSSYRIKGRAASYYLLPKVIQVLKTNLELDPKGLHLQYYSRNAKATFTNHWLRLFRIYLKLDTLFDEDLDFFTSSELATEENYPRPLPDGFLSWSGSHQSTPDCMFELLESSTALDRLRQRVNCYMAHREADEWSGEYPAILLVCDNAGLERELQRYIARTLDYRGSRLTYYTTTIKAVLSMKDNETPI